MSCDADADHVVGVGAARRMWPCQSGPGPDPLARARQHRGGAAAGRGESQGYRQRIPELRVGEFEACVLGAKDCQNPSKRARVQQVHRVDDHRRVGGVLAGGVGELLDRLDGLGEQLVFPVFQAGVGPVAVGPFDVRGAVLGDLGQQPSMISGWVLSASMSTASLAVLSLTMAPSPSRSLPPRAARSAALLMYLAARRSNAGGNMTSAGSPAWRDAASAVICPNPASACPEVATTS